MRLAYRSIHADKLAGSLRQPPAAGPISIGRRSRKGCDTASLGAIHCISDARAVARPRAPSPRQANGSFEMTWPVSELELLTPMKVILVLSDSVIVVEPPLLVAPEMAAAAAAVP